MSAESIPEKGAAARSASVLEKRDGQEMSLEKIIVVMMAVYLAVFIVALDRTIIATAIPRITDEFNALDDVSWFGSSYLLTQCSFQLVFGRVNTLYSPKIVLLGTIVLFEIGSLLCAVAPNATTLIVGRAIAGLGSGGIFAGGVVVIVRTVPLAKRPIFQGIIGAVFGLATVIGPILGGAFTLNVSWRWCFYINLPIGGFTLVVLAFVLGPLGPAEKGLTTRQKLAKLDTVGTTLFIASVVCLLLALQWGGTTYAWSNARIIVLFVVFGLCMIAFVATQIIRKEDAMVPPRIFYQRSMVSGMLFASAIGGSMMIFLYYMQIWFQGIKDASPSKAGVMSIPMILALVVGSILGGGGVKRIGYYTPFMILSSVLMSVGAGLLSTLSITTGHQQWIGYQVIYGLGIGLGNQQPGMAAQVVLKDKDVPIGVSLVLFAQSFGGSIFLSVAQNIFATQFSKHLESISGLSQSAVAAITHVGVTKLRELVPANLLEATLRAYNSAIMYTFYLGAALAAVSIIGALAMEWKHVGKIAAQAKLDAEGQNVDTKEIID